jgi:DNA polymerase-3 subunit delta'
LRAEVAEPAEGEALEFPAHPDFHRVEPDGAYVKVDQVRELQRALGLVANEGGRRVGVILAAERMRVEAANALLKTLEEPPRGAVIVLVAESSEGLPRTLRSRTTRLRFGAVREADLARALATEGAAEADARLAAALGGASVASARAWAERNGETAAELAGALAAAPEWTPSELLDFAETFRGGGEAARERTELFLDVYSALARSHVERALRAGDVATARAWLRRAEACAAQAREWRRRNLSPQLVVEGLLFDLVG